VGGVVECESRGTVDLEFFYKEMGRREIREVGCAEEGVVGVPRCVRSCEASLPFSERVDGYVD
jgi:hypothetical protein